MSSREAGRDQKLRVVAENAVIDAPSSTPQLIRDLEAERQRNG